MGARSRCPFDRGLVQALQERDDCGVHLIGAFLLEPMPSSFEDFEVT